jgi:dsRNA-specific ribonuclease
MAYKGPRDETFKELLDNILKTGDVSKKHRDEILNKEGLEYYSLAFTHATFDSQNNYEFLETLGDITLSKCVIWYISKKFPQINVPDGKDILTRLKNKIIQSKSYADFAESLGFWPFISTNMNRKSSYLRKKTLEDVLESFFAVTELLLDKTYKVGAGYPVCYKILSKLLDNTGDFIRIDYNHLADKKTRVKEIFDFYNSRGIGKLEYEKNGTIVLGEDDVIYRVRAKHTFPNGKYRYIAMGEGDGVDFSIAEQDAAEKVLEVLEKEGYTKTIPQAYVRFCAV